MHSGTERRHPYGGVYYLPFAAELFIEKQKEGSYKIKCQLCGNIPVKARMPSPIAYAGYVIEKVKRARFIEPQEAIRNTGDYNISR